MRVGRGRLGFLGRCGVGAWLAEGRRGFGVGRAAVVCRLLSRRLVTGASLVDPGGRVGGGARRPVAGTLCGRAGGRRGRAAEEVQERRVDVGVEVGVAAGCRTTAALSWPRRLGRLEDRHAAVTGRRHQLALVAVVIVKIGRYVVA
ncbi:MAG TPA: hypothetical protein VI011_14180 [Asanoa sp.]